MRSLLLLALVFIVAVAASGHGDVANHGAKSLRVPTILSTSPVEPHVCDVNGVGKMVYADDTDDALTGRLCICLKLSGATFDWIDLGTVAIATGLNIACPFF